VPESDFRLVSTELREPYPPVACRILRRLRNEGRDDLALESYGGVMVRTEPGRQIPL
jgi:hypothetical protein